MHHQIEAQDDSIKITQLLNNHNKVAYTKICTRKYSRDRRNYSRSGFCSRLWPAQSKILERKKIKEALHYLLDQKQSKEKVRKWKRVKFKTHNAAVGAGA